MKRPDSTLGQWASFDQGKSEEGERLAGFESVRQMNGLPPHLVETEGQAFRALGMDSLENGYLAGVVVLWSTTR